MVEWAQNILRRPSLVYAHLKLKKKERSKAVRSAQLQVTEMCTVHYKFVHKFPFLSFVNCNIEESVEFIIHLQ